MFLGYLFLSIPLGSGNLGMLSMYGALLLVCCGTGLFKGNLQVMVGNLYDNPQYESKRDSAFSIFYMAINIGALFAPSAAVGIKNWGIEKFHLDAGSAYHFAFGVACLSLILSIAIYYVFRSTFKHVEGKNKVEKVAEQPVEELSKQETKSRIVALCLVFAVVIFFWMAFHQNGLTLTFFANEFTAKSSSGFESMFFDVWNLVFCIIIVYALFALFQSKSGRGKLISGILVIASVAGLIAKYMSLSGSTKIDAEIFQQFNPCFVVALTPVSIALFSWLAKNGKEPSAPRKIGLGMLVAALGYVIMTVGSLDLLTPNQQLDAMQNGTATFVSPNWLISTYLVLTFGELLLSPMGISFVSKVAPPKYKGMMMGGWFVATAVGNKLTSVCSSLWGDLPLTVVWGILVGLCVLSAVFIFSIIKKLEKVC